MTMTTAITQGVKVSVEAFYHPAQSQPTKSIYVFIYEVFIENHGAYPVQLLRRHWHIKDGYLLSKEVEGEGVVGQQPILAPGEIYNYFSSCSLTMEMGKMFGSYLMKRLDNDLQFEVAIPEFQMVFPPKLN